eukprot:g66540.t1
MRVTPLLQQKAKRMWPGCTHCCPVSNTSIEIPRVTSKRRHFADSMSAVTCLEVSTCCLDTYRSVTIQRKA